ncbi:2-succinyl-5-enolpyruvyl-6-hydroxy-3-cyclohexene-1-carboxylic-acid synthase [Plantibacter sp. VKM Ac-2880]|uniref:2-succinyl-5-enolpyruvyl-6-hydroxy-3- cyclohexene-1-carboxylic-acid synthase n=1 Tax=Plantibacter sp. VKM Ac-2880 TaxID=2783827 RepID=UPI00188EB545|nr:2-succinyl-5-enolpyruvyl-6-hydroxy-3-cyclohexene-1-carboxylic-acid synthase [Plantibacter sp. VKM Ac-2880]
MTPPAAPEPVGSAASASPASASASALLGAFVAAGVSDIVVCPGSRSQALALAAAELAAAGRIALHVRIDERVAGFLALGLAVESGRPAVVITTSGTATANLHPAVLEAHQSRVPLIVLTADRPIEAHGVRANQTTRQDDLYGSATRLAVVTEAPTGAEGEQRAARELAREAYDAATGILDPGPVHLDLAYREPLSGAFEPEPDADAEAEPTAGPSVTADDHPRYPGRPRLVLERGPRTLVVAGHDAGPAAEQLAADGGWPLIAEVSSGARFGRQVIAAYRELLREDDYREAVERVVVFGHPTLSREVPLLLQQDAVETIVVAPAGAEVYNPGRRADHIVSSVTVEPGPADRAWLGAWVVGSRERVVDPSPAAPDLAGLHSTTPSERLASVRAELDAVRLPVTREVLVDAVWRATWPHDRLVVGASRLIRVADGLVPGRKIRVHANRGLAGIDGTIATATGIALASQADGGPGVTRVLLGDLAFLHDVGALLLEDGIAPRLQVIVGNDGGGTIFDGLEVARSAPSELFDRVQYTPQRVRLESLAAAYGWKYRSATTRAELDQAFTAPVTGPVLIEVPLPRA